MLAGLFKAPTKYAPHINLPAARARANDVLTNMVEAGFLTEGQVRPRGAIRRRRSTAAREIDARLLPRLGLRAGEGLVSTASGDKGADREDAARPRGCSSAAEQAIEDMLREYGEPVRRRAGRDRRHGPDGAMRAMVGGRDYGAEPVQPRDQRAPPAGLLLQALRLCDGARRPDIRPTPSSSTRRSPSATGRRRTTAAPSRARCR